MNTYLASSDKPETDKDGVKITSQDEYLAAERYVEKHHDYYDWEEECEVWLWLPGEIKDVKKYLVYAERTYNFSASIAEDQED